MSTIQLFGIRKVYRWLLLTLLAFLSLLMLISAVFSLFYEKAVINYLQKYMYEHLVTQVSMDKINIRLFTGFPNITFDMRNVVVLSGEDFSPGDFVPGDAADTLLSAEKINFRFNFLKALNQVYELKKIDVKNGFVNILTDTHDKRNTVIWESKTGQGSAYSIQLRNIDLDFVDIRMTDLKRGFELSTRGDRIKIRGSFAPGKITAHASGNMHLNYLTMSDNEIFDNSSLKLNVGMDYSDSILRITDSQVEINRIPVSINSMFDNAGYTFSISIPGANVDELVSVLDLAPDFTEKYKMSGEMEIKATLSGSMQTEKNSITADFKLADGMVINNATGKKITRITFRGSASGLIPGSTRIVLSEVKSSAISGSTNIEFDSKSKIFDFNDINSTIDLSEITSFFNGNSLAEGSVVTSDTKATINTLNESRSAFEFVRYFEKGHLSFENLKIPYDNGKILEKLQGEISFSDSLYVIDTASVKAGDNTFHFKGTVTGLYDYLTHDGTLEANLDIDLEEFNLTGYFTGEENEGNSGGNIIPRRLDIKATLTSSEFVVSKFMADNLKVNLHLINNSVKFNNFNFNFFDGTISGNAEIKTVDSGGFSITCNTESSDVNIQELFSAFNNFAQNFIIDRNIAGSLNGTISFYSEWDANFELMPDKISAIANVSVNDGELIEFEPMMQLSKYVDARELEHVKFSTLRNIINIKDRQVVIPEMTINSNAFNITAAGTHSFDNNFDYRLKVLLSEVLFNRARSRRNEINEFYVSRDLDERFTIPLIVAGTPDNFDVRFDKQRAFSLAGDEKVNRPAERQKEVANQDFVIEWDDPRDSIVIENKKTQNEDFIIEW